MTEADLLNVESALGLKLPAYYRDFMLNYPAGLLAFGYGPEGEPGEPADDWLHWRPETIIRENLSIRQHLPFHESASKTIPWPADYLSMANNGGGDHWYIDVTAPPGMEGLVWKWEHDSGRWYMVATSLQAWVEKLVTMFQKFQIGEY